MKEEFLSERGTRGADSVPQRFVHAHVLIRNGQKAIWGSEEARRVHQNVGRTAAGVAGLPESGPAG